MPQGPALPSACPELQSGEETSHLAPFSRESARDYTAAHTSRASVPAPGKRVGSCHRDKGLPHGGAGGRTPAVGGQGERGTSDGSAAARMGKCQGWSKAAWEDGGRRDPAGREAERRGWPLSGCGLREAKRWGGVRRCGQEAGPGGGLRSLPGNVCLHGEGTSRTCGQGERGGCGHSRKGPQPVAGAAGSAGDGEVARPPQQAGGEEGLTKARAEGKPRRGLLERGVGSAAGPGCGEAGAEGTREAGQWRVHGQG